MIETFKVHYSYQDFIDNYDKQLISFRENYPDAELKDFLDEYLIFVSQCFENVSTHDKQIKSEVLFNKNWTDIEVREIQDYIKDDDKLRKNLRYTFKKIKQRLLSLRYGNIDGEERSENIHLQWHGKQTELIELIKALKENGNLKGKQKDIIEIFSTFFNIEIKNPDKLITDIKKRSNGSETLFLDKLKSSLYNYIIK